MSKQKQRKKAYSYLNESRIPHVMGCEETAVRLAEKFGVDADKAETAAMLHDITKKLSFEEHMELIEKYHLDCDDGERAAPKLLHAKTGAAFARDLFDIDDEIYSAIRYHTTGKREMTILQKIIYLADYIEPTRDFPGVEKLREVTFSDLDRGMELGLKMSIEEIEERGQIPYRDTLEAYEYYKTTES